MKSQPVDFASLLEQIEAFRSLKQMEADTGISYSHLVNLKKGHRGEPAYSMGVKIIEYHQAIIARRFDHLKARIKGGWQM